MNLKTKRRIASYLQIKENGTKHIGKTLIVFENVKVTDFFILIRRRTKYAVDY